MTIKKACNFISIVGMVFVAAACILPVEKGIFASQEKPQSFVLGFGLIGGLVFVFIQIVQVVIPIIPGGISCLAGVVLFGAGMGFLYNYVGICAGSILAFLIAKAYGRPLLKKCFSPSSLKKYESWTETKNRFTTEIHSFSISFDAFYAQ